MAIRIAVLIVIMAAFSIEIHAASFDCAKARSRGEILICSDPELSALDDELAKIYAKAKALAPSLSEFKAHSEREWKRRETTCFDKPCLLAWYAQRREQLLSIVNAQTSTPPPPTAPAPVKDAAGIAENQKSAVVEKTAPPPPPPPPPAREQKSYQIAGAGYYGCKDKENFKRLRDLLMQGNDAAFLKEMTAGVQKGDCVMYNKGEKVSLEEGVGISTVIRIKKEGESYSHWTTPKAILPQSGK